MFKKTNKDTVSKAMQNAGLKEVLKNLKEMEDFSRSNTHPIVLTIECIISAYNCIPCKCLAKRVKKIKSLSAINELKYNIKSLIYELEAFLDYYKDDIQDNMPNEK